MATPRKLTISLPPVVARQLDRVARAEGRSRSDLLREAFRQYVGRLERWERIFAAGSEAGRRSGVKEADVARVVKEHRRLKAC